MYNNSSRFGKYLMMEDEGLKELCENTDEINEITGSLQECIEDYYEGTSDKSQLINIINELRLKLDELEDNI